MNALLQGQGWYIVGWTMVYFLIAGTLVLIAGAVLRFALRKANPTIRYTTSLAVFATIALLPIAIAGSLASRVVPDPGQRSDANLESFSNQVELDPTLSDNATEQALLPEGRASASVESNLVPPVQRRDEIASLLTEAVEILPWVWIVGTPLTFLLLASGLVGAERLRKTSRSLDAGQIVETCDSLRKALGVGCQVSVAVCERVATPLLVGIVRPLILLPTAALTGWSQAELEMVLLHELAHVRRWDNLVNLVQRVVESLLFFHPAVWIASRWIRRDREDCCDRIVVGYTAKPQAYAELLLALASPHPHGGLAASVAMSEHPLAARIRRILNLEDEPMLVSRKTLITIATGVLSLLLTVALIAPPSTDAEEPQTKASRVVPDPGTSERQTKASRERERPEEEEKSNADTESNQKEKSNPLFPTLEEQRAADVAYKLLGVELEKLSEKELKRVLAMGYRGGMRIDTTYKVGSLNSGDLLVGLHVWPTESLDQVNKILTRDDIGQLSPLKFYVIRKKMEGKGAIGPLPLGLDQLVTGRVRVDIDAWRNLPRIKAASEARLRDAEALRKEAERERATEKLLYDGKTFDQWRNAWKTDLKTENRTECIKALAAFGLAGNGQDAAEAILNVAGQYDFYVIDSSAEGKLKEKVIELLTSTVHSRLNEKYWLPLLQKRLEKEPEKYKWLAWNLLARLKTDNPEVKEDLLELQRNPDEIVSRAALGAIFSSDSIINDGEKKDLYLQTLLSNPRIAAELLSGQRVAWLSVDDLLRLFLNEDKAIQVSARKHSDTLRNLKEKDAAQFIQRLKESLSGDTQRWKQFAAIRTLASLGYLAKEADPELSEFILETQDETLMVAALHAKEMVILPEGHSRNTISDESLNLLKESERWRHLSEDVKKLNGMLNSEKNSVYGVVGLGGGFGGGGGGFF